MNDAEFKQLVSQKLDGELSAADAERLERAVQVSSLRRRQYLEMQVMHRATAVAFTRAAEIRAARQARSRRRQLWFVPATLTALAAMLTLVALGDFARFTRSANTDVAYYNPHPTRSEPYDPWSWEVEGRTFSVQPVTLEELQQDYRNGDDATTETVQFAEGRDDARWETVSARLPFTN